MASEDFFAEFRGNLEKKEEEREMEKMNALKDQISVPLDEKRVRIPPLFIFYSEAQNYQIKSKRLFFLKLVIRFARRKPWPVANGRTSWTTFWVRSSSPRCCDWGFCYAELVECLLVCREEGPEEQGGGRP